MFETVFDRKCPRCGTAFRTNAPRRIYCSDDCRRGSGVCEGCGKPFVLKAGTAGRFCSPTCWYATKNGRTRICPSCEKPFHPKAGNQTYCSVACRHVGLRRPARTDACAYCGGVMPAHAKTHQTFCSRTCAKSARFGHENWSPDGTTRLQMNSGYVQVKIDGEWYYEHRVVMEGVLGRRLRPGENVHHKDGQRANNVPENLELWVRPQPYGTRVSDMIERIIGGAEPLGLTSAQTAGLRAVVERELASDKRTTREKPYDPADDAKDVTLEPSSEQQRLLL